MNKSDEGWAETSKMLGESALVLALATEKVRRETKLQGERIATRLKNQSKKVASLHPLFCIQNL